MNRDLGAIADDLEAGFAKIQLPTGFSIRLAGQIQQQRETFEGLLFATVLALVLVYMVMAAQFKSLIDPFIIMFSVPMGFPGVILILFLTNTTLSTTSMMGIIMMLGIVVSNGVLLVDYTNVLRRRGRALHDAAVTAARTRLRPILMTSLATVLGLLPMAIGWGTGGETNAPLARAVVGGLSVSTMLTLFLVPTMYVMLEERFPQASDRKSRPRSREFPLKYPSRRRVVNDWLDDPTDLPDGWKERLQLHRQANIPADLEPARHGDSRTTQLAVQHLDAILSRHREHDMRIRMHSFFDLTGAFTDREDILPALRPAQIELVDRIKIFGSIRIEPSRQRLKKLFDLVGFMSGGEGLLRSIPGAACPPLPARLRSTNNGA